MFRKITFLTLILALSLVMAGPAAAGPSFAPALWADGELFATQGLAILPAPDGSSPQSFDQLFVIVNSNNPAGQLPVAEAAPGNPDYNGGRWATQTVAWTAQGFADHGTVPVLTSYADIMVHYNLGHLIISSGSPEGGPPDYFECPLLPVQ